MSTNLEYRAGERQRKRESRRQASEAQREKGRKRSRVREKKQSRHFLLEEQHENFVATVTKWEMGNSRKYPYPTTDGFHVLTPPLAFGNSKMPQNSIIVNPPSPSEFHGFFGSTFST